jgi:hypothetical protein
VTRERERAYFQRLGELKAASHEEALRRHRALPIEERLARSWQLYEAYRDSVRRTERGDDALQFYAKARARGLYRP